MIYTRILKSTLTNIYIDTPTSTHMNENIYIDSFQAHFKM